MRVPHLTDPLLFSLVYSPVEQKVLECRAKMKSLFAQRIVLLTLATISVATFGMAQSGRRGTNKPTTTAPTVAEPKTTEAKPQKPSRLQLLVAVDNPDSFSNTPFYLTNTVLDTCVRRLAEASEVMITPAPRHMNRGEAIMAAKAEKERYVVWLQLSDDLAGSAPQARNNSQQWYIDYLILKPGTGKIKSAGRTHSGAYKTGNVVLGPGPTSRSPAYSEYAVKQSAREAAEKILEAFGIKLGDEQWPR